ncbi:MAG: tRNA pseudouridine(38-40) synthase TruA [Verrucomicrobiota bacterium]|nr:tRNA pseudouridine(38-40) synthase TruA [Verrucomicrobiota bacterium]
MTPTRIKLVIAYDGTNYAGWQVQQSGTGVQEVIEGAFAKLFNIPFRIYSSSRTDAGVHAIGMVAHVDVPLGKFKMTDRKLGLALNAHLPPDIRVFESKQVAASFHARFNASGKQYRYFVWNHPAHHPLLHRQIWHVPQPLLLQSMKHAARDFLGKHDFASFAATRDYKMNSTVRTVTRCDIRRSGYMFTFIIEGDGFLYKMCRGIVGTLVQVGQGKIEPAAIPKMLHQKDRKAAGMSAPAAGLVLWKVFYKRSATGKIMDGTEDE